MINKYLIGDARGSGATCVLYEGWRREDIAKVAVKNEGWRREDMDMAKVAVKKISKLTWHR